MAEADLFLVKPDDFKPFFRRCIELLQEIISIFADEFAAEKSKK